MISSPRSNLNSQQSLTQFSNLFKKGHSITDILATSFDFIISLGSTPAKLLLRKNLGERTVSPAGFIASVALHIYFGLALLGVVLSITTAIYKDAYRLEHDVKLSDISIETNQIITILVAILLSGFIIYLALFIRAGIKHFSAIYLKKEPTPTYSYDRGQTKYFHQWLAKESDKKNLSEEYITRFIEPKRIVQGSIGLLILLIVSAIIFNLNANIIPMWLNALAGGLIVTAIACFFGSICLLIEEITIEKRIRYAALDIQDAPHDMQLIEKQKAKLMNEENETNTPSQPDFVQIIEPRHLESIEKDSEPFDLEQKLFENHRFSNTYKEYLWRLNFMVLPVLEGNYKHLLKKYKKVSEETSLDILNSIGNYQSEDEKHALNYYLARENFALFNGVYHLFEAVIKKLNIENIRIEEDTKFKLFYSRVIHSFLHCKFPKNQVCKDNIMQSKIHEDFESLHGVYVEDKDEYDLFQDILVADITRVIMYLSQDIPELELKDSETFTIDQIDMLVKIICNDQPEEIVKNIKTLLLFHCRHQDYLVLKSQDNTQAPSIFESIHRSVEHQIQILNAY